MTCIVAVRTKQGAVMLSDSQGSTPTSEMHGWHKQYAGPDFIIGCAGHGLCINLILKEAAEKRWAASTAAGELRRFVEREFEPELQRQFSALILTGDSILERQPGIRTPLRHPLSGAIGSGAEFIRRASNLEKRLGVTRLANDLVDAFLLCEHYLDAANESLTVDDQLAAGLLVDGRAYCLGDARVSAAHAPKPIRKRWAEVGVKWTQVLAMSQTIRAELAAAQRYTSLPLWVGKQPSAQALGNSTTTVAVVRQVLADALREYCSWYDGVLGR